MRRFSIQCLSVAVEEGQPEQAPFKASGLAALVATHNMDLAARMDRRVTIRDGQVREME